jgi:alkylhydroperoxidase family enzyme
VVVVEVALVAAAALVCGIGVSAYRAFRSRHVRVARKLAAARRVPIADFADGETALVVGRVVVGAQTLRGPISDKACVFYRLQVEGPMRVGQEPESLLETGEGVDFFVEDETGRARVIVAGADVSLVKHPMASQQAIDRGVDARVPAQLAQGLAPLRMSFFEGRLDAGEQVAIAGRGHWRTAAAGASGGGYRHRPKQLEIGAPAVISDRPFESQVAAVEHAAQSDDRV